MFNYHAHQTSASRDCDGLYDSYRTWWPDPSIFPPDDNDAANGRPVNEYDFEAALLRGMIPLTSQEGPTNIEIATTRTGDPTISVYYPTEEGFVYEAATLCRDDCPDENSQRDHNAERAGY